MVSANVQSPGPDTSLMSEEPYKQELDGYDIHTHAFPQSDAFLGEGDDPSAKTLEDTEMAHLRHPDDADTKQRRTKRRTGHKYVGNGYAFIKKTLQRVDR